MIISVTGVLFPSPLNYYYLIAALSKKKNLNTNKYTSFSPTNKEELCNGN